MYSEQNVAFHHFIERSLCPTGDGFVPSALTGSMNMAYIVLALDMPHQIQVTIPKRWLYLQIGLGRSHTTLLLAACSKDYLTHV